MKRKQLTDFLTALVDNYADIPYKLTECGYACSGMYIIVYMFHIIDK